MSTPPPLRAVTRRLDADVDAIDVAGEAGVLWDSPDLSLAGRGVAVRFEVERSDPAACADVVAARFDAIASEDEVDVVGSGPVALGAWTFDAAAPGELVVPEILVGTAPDGTRWVTTVAPAGDDDAHDRLVGNLLDDLGHDDERTLAGFSSAEPFDPSDFTLSAIPTPEAWCAAVASARDELRDGFADKVVLAREVRVTANADLPVTTILRRLRRTFPDALRFSIDGFLGASPELLVGRSGDIVRCHPLAGTAPRSGDPAADARLAAALIASTKNRTEHQHTIDLVYDALIGYCSYFDAEAEPSVVAVANVQHLGTRVQGRLSSPPASVIELATVLHPTPAVCGRERHAAAELIARHEVVDRGRYAGPVGWVDARGNGAWAVGIRSASISGSEARVLAGVGVVADSDPVAELAETRAKLAAMLGAIVRP